MEYRVGIGVDQRGGADGSPTSLLLCSAAQTDRDWGYARAKPGSARQTNAPSPLSYG